MELEPLFIPTDFSDSDESEDEHSDESEEGHSNESEDEHSFQFMNNNILGMSLDSPRPSFLSSAGNRWSFRLHRLTDLIDSLDHLTPIPEEPEHLSTSLKSELREKYSNNNNRNECTNSIFSVQRIGEITKRSTNTNQISVDKKSSNCFNWITKCLRCKNIKKKLN